MLVDLTALLSRLRLVKTPEQRDAPVGIVVGETESGTPVVLASPTPERSASVQVLGASGSGKTAMIVGALAEEISADGATSYLIVDPKGDAVTYLLGALGATAPEALSRVRYLNPFEDGFPLNLVHLPRARTPIEMRARQLASLVGRLSTDAAGGGAGIGARQLDLLQAVLAAALASTDLAATPLWALEALLDERGLAALTRRTTRPYARRLLAATERVPKDVVVSTAARLRLAFSATPTITAMLEAPSCVSFAELLGPGAITVLDLSDPLGVGELRGFFASLVLRLALDQLLERPSPWRGHHTRLVVDEAHLVADVLADSITELVTTSRSRGASWIGAVQGTVLLSQASPALLEVLLTNCEKLIGRLHARDAELLARAVAPARGSDESFASVRARVAAQVVGFRDREFYQLNQDGRRRFVAREHDVEAWLRAAPQALKNVRTPKPVVEEEDVQDDVVRDRGNSSRPTETSSSQTAREPADADAPASPTRWG